MTWVDDLFTGIKRVLWEGVLYPQHQRVNFKGSGVQVADNPSLGATDVTIEIDLDDLDGDRIDIDWDPTHYTPDASPPEAFDEDDLTAHLAGIDNELGDINTALEGTFDPNAHAATHENGGTDEIDVTGLSGLLADPQTPIAHSHPHSHGSDDIANESGVEGTTVSDALDNLEAAIGPAGSSDAWPSACALVFDFTKPATVAIHSAITTGDLASGYSVSPEGVISPYTEIGAPTGNDYPVHVIDEGTSSHFVEMEAVVDGRSGYKVIRVCAEAAHHSWIFVDSVSGVAAGAYFNLATGAVGTTEGLHFLAAAATSDGDGGYVCDILVDGPGDIRVRVYVCDSDGTPTATGWASGPAIILKQFDRLHWTAGQDVIQKTVERIESIGSRRTTCAWQDENEESQPALLDGYTPLLPTAGALFAGNQNGLGVNAKRLRILDPAGAYDLVRQLSAPGAPWALYVVCTKPDDDAAERILFNLGAATTREVSAFFYDGDVILRDRNGATICDADIAQPAASGMHLFAFYYGGGTLRVGADDLLGSIATNTNICSEPFTVATLGGSGTVAFVALSECRALMQLAVFVPMACAPLSDLDTAIRAKIATDFGVTTLLET